ncbi:MAG: NUDIX hydrolase [Elusimicrobiota bacterium]|nr:NUDIX hydrolase [Elusimicrobiota bacterium]
MKKRVEFEFSAGGVVVDNNKVLVIKTKNLKGEKVITFPKGHIEKKEKAVVSAIREVEEETGYKCEILNQLDAVQYWFKDRDRLVKKTVKWFLMKPIKKVKEPSFEVSEIKWLKFDEAKKTLSYRSDKALLEKLLTFNL